MLTSSVTEEKLLSLVKKPSLIQSLSQSFKSQAPQSFRGNEVRKRDREERKKYEACLQPLIPDAVWVAYIGPNKREGRGRKKRRVDGVMHRERRGAGGDCVWLRGSSMRCESVSKP